MNLCINDFEGPLGLLLHLVKTAKMDIYDIDTKYIIDKYLEFINSVKNDLDVASEYLVMASELIHLKSRLLLNLDNDENDDSEYSINSEEDLKNKLIEYERYQSVTNIFKDLEEKRKEFFTKLPENLKQYKEEIKLEGNSDAELLKEAIMNLQKRIDYQKPVNTKITKKEISVEERKDYIRKRLEDIKRICFTDLFTEYSKDLVVATFLSILDMCKHKEIMLKQDGNFKEIYIERVI